MSFTQDELQTFHTILEQRLSIHRREMERNFEQHLGVLKREFEQRLAAYQQEQVRTLTQHIEAQQKKFLGQRFEKQQRQMTQAISQEVERGQRTQQQRIEEHIERSLAAQLLAIEHLLNQHNPSSNRSTTYTIEDSNTGFESIEVQTEVSWDDLVDVVSKAVSERISALDESVQNMIRHMELYVETELSRLRSELRLRQEQSYGREESDLHEIFVSIDQLERIVESMQVAMAANQALLSNRLYHHQQLPHERAHPAEKETAPRISHSNGTTSQLAPPKEKSES